MGKSALLQAAGRGDAAGVAQALEHGADIMEADAQGSTALHRAARGGHEEVVALLIKGGGEPVVHAKDRKMLTPLHEASACGHAGVAEMLLKAGAKTNAAKINSSLTNGGFQPLHFAAGAGHLECARVLLDAGADVRGGDRAGECPLHGARPAPAPPALVPPAL